MLAMGPRQLWMLCFMAFCLTASTYKFLESKDRWANMHEFGEGSAAAVQAASGSSSSPSETQTINNVDKYSDYWNGRSILATDAVNQRALPPVPNVPGGSTRNPEARLIYRRIVIDQNGTAIILSADKSTNPDLPWGATAFSYSADLHCGSSSPVGTCYLAGSITKALKDPTAAQTLMDGQCELNSHAASCEHKLKGGARVLLRGLAAVKFHKEGSVPEQQAIEGIYADRLFVRDILYNAGPDTVVGRCQA